MYVRVKQQAALNAALATIFLLICVSFASANWIVLKSGKKIEGTIVQEDESTVHVKQPDGVILILKKDQIDLSGTFLENESAAQTQIQPQTNQSSKKAADTKSHSATQTKKIGNTQTFTNKDIKDMPEISVLGTTDTDSGAHDKKPKKESGEKLHESVWRAEAHKLHENKLVAVEYCKRRYRQVEREDTNDTEYDPNCPAIVDVNRQIDDFKERARKASVPDQWIADVDSE